MSTTTVSPGWMTLLEATWWGLAAFAPAPTIVKHASSWPPRMAAWISPASSSSVRPAQRSPSRPSTTRSRAAATRASASTSSGSLRMRGCLEAQQEGAPELVADPEPAGGGAGRVQGGADQPDGVLGLLPGGHLQVEAAEVVAGQRRLQRGDDQPRVAGGRQHQQGHPLQRRRLVAGQVAEVGGGPEQQRVHVALAELLARPPQPLGARADGRHG